MARSSARQILRYERQDLRKRVLTQADRKDNPRACELFVIFGGKLQDHVGEVQRMMAVPTKREEGVVKAFLRRRGRIGKGSNDLSYINRARAALKAALRARTANKAARVARRNQRGA